MFWQNKKQKTEKQSRVDQALIDNVRAYIDSSLNPPKQEAAQERDPNARYSLRDRDGVMADIIRIAELGGREPTFTEEVLRFMKERGYSSSQCYKKAHIDRKLFSQIMKDRNYTPKKTTAIAFVLALQLNCSQAACMLRYAGYALKSNDNFDLIIQYCIRNRIYDIDDVNEILYEFGQPLLGSK